jgi:hypothetical protein
MEKLIYLLMILMFSGCIKDDDELTIFKTPFNDNILKTNGYYYNVYFRKDPIMVEVVFLYKDGVLLNGSGFDSLRINEVEEKYSSGEYYNNSFDRKYNWGAFIIQGDSIFIERWYPSSRPYWAYRQSGIILNDSTYRLTGIVRVDGTEEDEIDRTYHFKQFSPKPDSTNSFIK